MGLNKRLISAASGAGLPDDERLTGSPSLATTGWVASTGTGSSLRYRNSSSPLGSFSSVTVGNSYIRDAQWDGFTWIVATGNGIYQTTDSSCATGWTNVVSGGDWNNITPVPGGNLVFNSGSNPRGIMAYTSTLNPSTPSSSYWATKATPSIGSNYILSTTVTNNRVVIGRRYDVNGIAFYYSQENDWFLDNDLNSWVSGQPGWGYSIASNGTELVGVRRGNPAFWYANDVGVSETGNTPSGIGSTIYSAFINYTNDYWITGYTQYGRLSYKTTYNGGWASNNLFSTSKTNTQYHSNGSYWAAGMNYGTTNQQAIRVQSTVNGTPQYVTQSQLGGESFGYVRAFVSSLQKNVGAWTNFGGTSPTFGE